MIYRLLDIDPDRDSVRKLAQCLEIPELWAQLLWNRGIETPDAYRDLISGRQGLSDPELLPDIKTAASLLVHGIHRNQYVRIYGDYDADGVTASALLFKVLTLLGANVDWHIPNRFDEGYGLQPEGVFQAHRDGVDLLVTVDCGSSSVDAVKLADSLGIPVIITDHHRLPSTLPPAVAHVNPERMDLPQVLSGAGVALQLGRMLLGEDPPPFCWALAAVGTVADVVPLKCESRILVRQGLEALRTGAVPGLAALSRVAGRELSHVTAQDVAFSLAPRINAAGRMGSPDRAVALCLAEDVNQGHQLAMELDAANQNRRLLEQAVLKAAIVRVPRDRQGRPWPFLLVDGEDWHEGVIGIAAARLADRFHRPAAVIAWSGQWGKGSARSGGQGDILAVLRRHQDRFAKLGGHPGAAGFSIARSQITGLAEALAETWRQEYGAKPAPSPRIDARVHSRQLTPELGAFIAQLEPFGHGFPAPRFDVTGQVREVRPMGSERQHLRIQLEDTYVDSVIFGVGSQHPALAGRRIDGEARLEPNWWRGQERWQIRWEYLRWPPSPEAPLTTHAWVLGHPLPQNRVLLIVNSPYHLRHLKTDVPHVKLFPHADNDSWAEVSEMIASHDTLWCGVCWWHESPPLSRAPRTQVDALWILAAPPHSWALKAALAWLKPGGTVYWDAAALDGRLAVAKWRRLVPDRERLLALWRLRQTQRSSLQPGDQILRDLDLEGGKRPRERRHVSDSLYFRTAWIEAQEAYRQWRAGNPWQWREEEQHEGLAQDRAGDS